jgi:hypothetical protein
LGFEAIKIRQNFVTTNYHFLLTFFKLLKSFSMKKLFMMAAAMALAFGVTSCANNDDKPIGPINDDETGMSLSLILPAGSNGATRGIANGNVEGSAVENEVKTVHIFMFNPIGGAKVEFGGYTKVDFSSTGATPTFSADATYTGDGVKWDMVNPVDASVGLMKVYVGINVPNVPSGGYANEQALLDALETVANLSVTTPPATATGITMISSVYNPTFVTVLAGDPIPASNKIDATVGRVVAKIVASTPSGKGVGAILDQSAWLKTDMTEDVTELTGSAVNLKYSLSHWRVFQNAVKSWVIAHPTTNKAAGTINSYGASLYPTPNPELAFITPTGTIGDNDLTNAASFQYIGENASEAGGAPNNVTTYIYVSTKLTVDGRVAWDATKKIHWETVAEYGGTSSPSDIIVLYHNGTGKYYPTNDQTVAQAIIDGVFRDGAREKLVNITATGADDPNEPGTEMTKEGFLAAYPEYVVESYTYKQGYVHFYTWINKEGTNNYNIARNQYIHMELSGIKDDAIEIYKFAGNVSQDPSKFYDNNGVVAATGNAGNVRYPTDLFDSANPNPLTPGENIDPEKTSMLVNVEVSPWVYRKNPTELQ